MLTPNQIRCINDYYNRGGGELYFICERHDCDYDQMQQIIDALDPLLPGKGLDYNAILARDPIACDPLLIHCNQTIGRLGEVYERMMLLFDASSGRDFTISKRTTFSDPPGKTRSSFPNGKSYFEGESSKEKVETTTYPDKHRFKLLETAMKCLDRSVKIQITLTQRKEKLLHAATSPTRLTATQRGARSQNATSSPQSHHEQPHTAANGLTGMTALQGYPLNSLPSGFERGAVAPPTASIQAPLPEATDPTRPIMQTSDERAQPLARSASEGESSHDLNLSKIATHLPGGLQPALKVQHAPPQINNQPATLLALRSNDAQHESNHQTLEETTAAIAHFGPAKDFTPHPYIEEFQEDRYAWRKKRKEAKRITLLAQQEKQPTHAQTTAQLPGYTDAPPPYHKRE